MRELISREEHLFHDESKFPLRDSDILKRHLAYCHSVFADENSVSLTYSNKYTGMTSTGKRWFRWENAQTYVLAKNENTGHVICRTSTRGARGIRRHFTHQGLTQIFLNDAAREAITERMGFKEWHDTVPLSEHFYGTANHPQGRGHLLAAPNNVATNLWLPLQKKDVFEMTTFAFGKTRYRKDLVKAVAQADPNAIAIAIDFRGLVPIDWIINFLRNNPRNEQRGVPPVSIPSVRPYLFPLEPRSLRRLLQTQVGPDNAGTLYGINDSVRSPRTQPQPGFVKNWGEFHDNLYGLRRNRNQWRGFVGPKDSHNSGKIKVISKAKPLAGLEIGTMKVVLPGHTDDLIAWGNEMRNCIGSYGSAALNGYSILGGIYEDDKLIANFEFKKDGTLKQLLGKHNKPMEASKRAAVVDKFKELEYNVTTYWGDSQGMNNNWF